MTTQQTCQQQCEWETPVREVAPGQVEIDGDDYCTTCGVERHELPQYRFLNVSEGVVDVYRADGSAFVGMALREMYGHMTWYLSSKATDEFPEFRWTHWETRGEMEAALQAYPPVNDAAAWDAAPTSDTDLRAFDAMLDDDDEYPWGDDPGLYDNDDPQDVESVR